MVLGIGIGPRVDPAFLHLGAGPNMFLVPGAVGGAADEIAVIDTVEGSRLLDAFVGIAHDFGVVAIGDGVIVETRAERSSSSSASLSSKSMPA